MNVDEASAPTAVSGKRVLRMARLVSRAFSWCLHTCGGNCCRTWLLPGFLVAILWFAGIGMIWMENRRVGGQLQQAVQDMRMISQPRLLAMLYEPRRENEPGNVVTGAHVRTRSAAVVAFVQLSRPTISTRSDGAKRQAKLVNLQELELPGAQLTEADLKGVDFSSANLSSSDLRGADLVASNFSKANLEEVRFRGVQAGQVRMEQAKLRGADFQAADLQGAEFFQSMLSEATIKFGQCKDASFREAGLRGANLEEADFRGANLVAADLRDASFRYSKLAGANLSEADLRGAQFALADLTGAKLQGANLEGVDFRESAGLTLPQVRLAKNWRLALFRQPEWVSQEAP
ncbi:MAG: hypothetical protein CMJ75_10525 [Planctomycetaceae bacterium]|nr:hypothetical protein [Planctomycetaceae bacterium]